VRLHRCRWRDGPFDGKVAEHEIRPGPHCGMVKARRRKMEEMRKVERAGK
jgi:hypothetical protein